MRISESLCQGEEESEEVQSRLRNSIVSSPSSLNVMGLNTLPLFNDCCCALRLYSSILLFTRSLKKRLRLTCHTLKASPSGWTSFTSNSASSSTTTLSSTFFKSLNSISINVSFCSLINCFISFISVMSI